MKHLFLSALIAFFALVSCSGDDNNQSISEASLIGVWQLESTSLNEQDFNLSPCQLQNTVEFTHAGRVTFKYYYGSNSDNCQTDAAESGDYVKEGNTVIITWDDSDEGLEVCQLTVTELSDAMLGWQTDIAGEGQLKEIYIKQ